MIAAEVYRQNNGDVTRAYYEAMNKRGYGGMLAVALFRAQKRSDAAKRYRKGPGFKTKAYEVKEWSISQVCMILQRGNFGFSWGWREDAKSPGHPWVLYVDLPTGQCSFHTARRLEGPNYTRPWMPGDGSLTAILAFCDSIQNPAKEKESTNVH